MNDCIFCAIANGQAPAWKVYEDEKAMAFLNIYPATPYHTLVIPKKHYPTIFDLPEDELVVVMKAVKKVATLYKTKLGIENIQIINNSGPEAQQDVFHLHFHLVPRKFDDGQNITWTTHPEMQEKFDHMLTLLK